MDSVNDSSADSTNDLTLELEDEKFDEPWSLDDFLIGKPLGKGRFGKVFLAKETRTSMQCLVALKILFKNMLVKTETTHNFKRECELQLSLNHPNVLRMYGWFHDESRIYLILEFAPKGNLYEMLMEREKLTNEEAAKVVYQTAKALMYIHSMNVVHRDLKPENIMIGSWGEVKIGDFGWANRCLSSSDGNGYEQCTSLAGTYDYLCPEIILKEGHDMRVDIWCLGVLMYEMLTGVAPFHASTGNETIGNILKVKYSCPSYIPRSASSLIGKLIVKRPDKRLGLERVIRERWIETFADKDETYARFHS